MSVSWIALSVAFIIIVFVSPSGAIKGTACGRMPINKSKMATGGRGPSLAPAPGRVELVYGLEHASAITPREYNPALPVAFP